MYGEGGKIGGRAARTFGKRKRIVPYLVKKGASCPWGVWGGGGGGGFWGGFWGGGGWGGADRRIRLIRKKGRRHVSKQNRGRSTSALFTT